MLAEKSNTSLLKICEDYEDDYIKAPKKSGYRALSVVVGVRVAVGSTVEPVTCEVQIRTLLQDAWGELTHEDTYKPEMKVPPFIVILSKRLANALAVLDEMAQDIRNELDKTEDRDTISEIPEDLTLSGAAVIPGNGIDEYPDVPRIAPTETPLTPNVESPHNGGAPDNGEDIRAALDAVFQRSPGISDKDIEPLSEHYRKWNLISKGDVERALSAMAAAILKIEANYLDIVQLNDLDRLYRAPFFLADSKRAARRIGLLLEKRLVRRNRGSLRVLATSQVSDRALVQERGRFESHRIFSW